MNERNYYIYKVMSDNEEENVFFRPNSSRRMTSLLAYRLSGYHIIAHIRVTEEEWYNAKLRNFCKEFYELDKEERMLHEQYREGSYQHSKECLLDTLTLIQDRKWFLLKTIYRNINLMGRRDIEVTEEIAILLYNQYTQAIL